MKKSQNHHFGKFKTLLFEFLWPFKNAKICQICKISKKKIKNQNKVDNHKEDKKMNNAFFLFFSKMTE